VSEVIGSGAPAGTLSEDQIDEIVARGLGALPLDGKRVLVLVPDGTRTFPGALFFRLVVRHLAPRVRAVDFLIALGTHPPMSEAALLALVGLSAEEKQAHYPNVRLLNHAWDNPDALTLLGTIPAEEIEQLSSGRLRQDW
jgi:nickel-dependent lactate racemase